MVQRKKTDIVQLKLRIREDLRRRLEKEAERRDISLNSEMVDRLERSFEIERTLGSPDGAVLFHAMATEIAAAKAKAKDEYGDKWAVAFEPNDTIARTIFAALTHVFPDIKYVKIAHGDVVLRNYASDAALAEDESRTEPYP